MTQGIPALFGVPTPTVDGARRFGWPDSFRENGELWFERAHIAPHDSWESGRLLFGFTGITAGAAAIAKFLFGLFLLLCLIFFTLATSVGRRVL